MWTKSRARLLMVARTDRLLGGCLCGQIRLVSAGRTSRSCVVSGCIVFMAHILDPMMTTTTATATEMMLLILDKSSPLSDYV